jgi:rhodanese-related sulfurtransferase/rubrerythrin
MKWKQFFTPVKSIKADEAREFMEKTGDFTLLDVRQPKEYQEEHLPGAQLIPIGDLGNRLSEIEGDKPVIVYCAVGGRSRVGAQMLAGNGFDEVYNLAGGIKAWQGKKAVGDQELGLSFFSGKESTEETLIVAYSLEEGLRAFYLSMIPEVKTEAAKNLFEKLADIEIIHQDRIFEEYLNATGKEIDRATFEESIVSPAMEGGLSTEEYLDMYDPDLESPVEIVSLAMAIEAQALDLYTRAAERAEGERKSALSRIADEERTHLAQLGDLMETVS